MTETPTTAEQHPCELCDVVKPSAYALHDHMSNVHPDQFEAWRDRQQPARSALATAVILPHPSDPDDVIVEAASSGISKAVVAYALRQVADQFDTAARAEGDEPIPYALTEQAEQLAAEQPARRILTAAEDEAAYAAARGTLGRHGARIGSAVLDEALTAALAAVGTLTPAPEPDPDTCPAMFADPTGEWQQCAGDPDHDPANDHDNGEWTWPHGETYARPEPAPRPTSGPDEPRIVVDVNDVEAALRGYLAHLDYDLHKGIERNEETGDDTYHAEAADLFDRLTTAAEAQQQ
ncbi:hypothetical protein [Streptomyces sp. NPDC056188]|uniref:hypothetical protein n=1 Tax=Streptomyces sp. NPDC056188 TaxID=3345740 RepID=UPI0035DF35DD